MNDIKATRRSVGPKMANSQWQKFLDDYKKKHEGRSWQSDHLDAVNKKMEKPVVTTEAPVVPVLIQKLDELTATHFKEQIFSFMKPPVSYTVLAKENLADFNQGTFNFAPVKQQKNELK